MSLEVYLEQLKGIERPISDADLTALLTKLRQTPSDIDVARSTLTEWQGRGNIFFHSLGDLRLVQMSISLRRNRGLATSEDRLLPQQACFVKDLDRYLQFFPETEPDMKKVFESIFRVGTSAKWVTEPQLPLDLLPIYTTLDRDLIGPWVAQEIK